MLDRLDVRAEYGAQFRELYPEPDWKALEARQLKWLRELNDMASGWLEPGEVICAVEDRRMARGAPWVWNVRTNLHRKAALILRLDSHPVLSWQVPLNQGRCDATQG